MSNHLKFRKGCVFDRTVCWRGSWCGILRHQLHEHKIARPRYICHRHPLRNSWFPSLDMRPAISHPRAHVVAAHRKERNGQASNRYIRIVFLLGHPSRGQLGVQRLKDCCESIRIKYLVQFPMRMFRYWRLITWQKHIGAIMTFGPNRMLECAFLLVFATIEPCKSQFRCGSLQIGLWARIFSRGACFVLRRNGNLKHRFRQCLHSVWGRNLIAPRWKNLNSF